MLQAKRVVVGKDRISFLVQVQGGPRFTSSELIALVLEDFPRLPLHACVNAKGPTFDCVMNQTSLPHLVEHMVIDLQVSAHASAPGPDPLFTGCTQWVDEREGIARIQVSYKDDLVALAAFKKALGYVNGLIG